MHDIFIFFHGAGKIRFSGGGGGGGGGGVGLVLATEISSMGQSTGK